MAEVTIRTVVEGFEEAARSFNKFDEQLKKITQSASGVGKAAKDASEGTEKLSGTYKTLTTFLNSVFGRILTVTGAFEVLRRSFSMAIGRAVEAEQNMLRFNAVLAATGHVVGLTADEMDKMSDSLKAATRFDDTGIRRAMTVLITFDRVQGDTFRDALSISADLAEMWGMDLSSAARLVGRALQSPEQGLGMLSRMIGRLKPEQERMIKLFMEQGDVTQAQGVLVDALKQKQGNLAQQMATSSVSAFQSFGRSVKEAAQELGKFLIPDTSRMRIMEGWLNRLTEMMRGPSEREKRTLELDERSAALREIIAGEWASVQEKRLAAVELERIERQQLVIAKQIIGERTAVDNAARDAREAANKEAADKAAAGEFKLALQALDLDIETNRARLQDRVAMIDARLAAMRNETQEERAEEQGLRKERLSTITQMRALEMARVDYMVRSGQAELEAKLGFLDRELKSARMSQQERIKLEMERFQVVSDIGDRESKKAAVYAKAIADTMQEQIDISDEYITMWNAIGNRIQVTRKEFEDFNTEAKRLEEAVDPMIVLRNEVDKLNKMFELNLISLEAYNAALEEAAKKLDQTTKKGEEMTEWQKEMLRTTQGFGREFTDAIVKTLDGAENAWGDFRDALVRMFNRTIIDQFITKPLEDALNDMIRMIRQKSMEAQASGGGFWQLLASTAMSYFTGGGTAGGSPATSTASQGSAALVDVGQPTVTALQHGGILPRGFTGMVGEAGPELVVPSTTSRIVPNDALRGQSAVIINQTFQSGVSRAELAQILPQLKAETIAGVMEAKQRGGRFSRVFR